MKLLAGQRALVTGAGQGIGAATAVALAAHGAAVIVSDQSFDNAAAVAKSINAGGGSAIAYGLDVADAEACAALHQRVRAEAQPISILVNNAGISGGTAIDALDAKDVWDRQIAVNLTGPFNVARAFFPSLAETRGSIVNVCSITSFAAATSAFGYVASKGGVKMLTQTMAREFARHGIRVNGVAPGIIDTPMTARRLADPDLLKEILPRVPLGRPGRPEEIAAPIVFLCSEMASYVTGAILPIDGGFLAV